MVQILKTECYMLSRIPCHIPTPPSEHDWTLFWCLGVTENSHWILSEPVDFMGAVEVYKDLSFGMKWVSTACLLFHFCYQAVSFLFLPWLWLPLVPTTLWFGVSNLLPCVEGLGNPAYWPENYIKILSHNLVSDAICSETILASCFLDTFWVVLSEKRFLGNYFGEVVL